MEFCLLGGLSLQLLSCTTTASLCNASKQVNSQMQQFKQLRHSPQQTYSAELAKVLAYCRLRHQGVNTADENLLQRT